MPKKPFKERLHQWAVSEHAVKKSPRLTKFYRIHFLKEHAKSAVNMKRLVLQTFPDVFGSRRIGKQDHRILGVGQKRAVLRLGSLVDLHTGEKKHLAVKLLRVKDKDVELQKNAEERGLDHHALNGVRDHAVLDGHYFFYRASEDNYWAEIRTLGLVRDLGIPVIEHPSVILLNPETREHIMVVEDLTEGGKKEVRELFGIGPRTISNPAELKMEFEKYLAILQRETKISWSGAHAGAKDLREEIERSFFVVIDPETRVGKLVFGDGDQIEPKTYDDKRKW
ncbi:MAG: hypothetical protein PHH82_03440 [Candidatus ainarchaeum sp.]|nr:hypothetical protein [Candidatus ainarchaeum sp.]